MSKLFFVFALSWLGASCLARAEDAPAPAAPPPVVTPLSDGDIAEIQKFVADAKDHRTMPDGSMHAMIDGNELFNFLMGKRAKAQRLATSDAQQKSDPDGAEAAKRAEALSSRLKPPASAPPFVTRRPPMMSSPMSPLRPAETPNAAP